MEQVSEILPVAAPFQVFINHRGTDAKKTLASLIYNRLTKCHGLCVFLDEKEIRTGDSLSPAIIGAIKLATVHVAIFSRRYAESSWCLEELHLILRSYHEGKAKIVPVFFGVEPKDLRHIESGLYAEAFEEHQRKGRVDMEVIENWKTALNQASMISGVLFKTDESDHGEILENIVNTVLKEVFTREAIEVAKYPVGLDQAAEDFQNEILKHSHPNATTIVGITGLGGMGKSTLAKHLFNLRRPEFSRSSICEVGQMGLRSSQKKLLRDLLGNYDSHHIDSISQGKRILKDCLPRLLPVFIVLDNVDNRDQIESLLDVDSVASKSLILITSRDKNVLRRSSSKTIIYDVKTLHQNHARELFCRYAFCQSKPSEELDYFVEEFLKICGGLPLCLKVLGGLFVGRCDKEYWKRQLEKLSTTLPHEIINSLRVSYEALDPEEKEVFLDIGCFLVGEEKELAIRVLEGLHDNSRIGDYLESLRQKCLLDFHYDVQSEDEIEIIKREYPYRSHKLTMHDQLRGLARHIAREEIANTSTLNPLRISSSYDLEEMLKLRVHGSKAKAYRSSLHIRGIRCSKDVNQPILNEDIRVEGVRLFVVEHQCFNSYMFPFAQWNMYGELVWLRLRSQISNVFSFNFFRTMSLCQLRVLEIQGSGDTIESFFQNLDHDLPHLNVLNIVDCTAPKISYKPGRLVSSHQTSSGKRKFPNFSIFQFAPKISYNPGSLKSSHQTSSGKEKSSEVESSLISQSDPKKSWFFDYLKNWGTGMKTLTRLVLKNIGFLQSLPIDFSQLQNLRHLDLSGCSELTELPNTFSELLQLQYLALHGCFNLSMPLDILGEISTLEYVDFQGCSKLTLLPEKIPHQRHLRYLNLLGTNLIQLPDNLDNLENLEQIRIGSRALKEIPLSVANLRGLTELFLLDCDGLLQISPEGIAAPNIKILVVDGCSIDNFSFQEQEILDVGNIYLRVGMRFLRDLTLKKTSIAEICFPEGVYSSLETIDLSENACLMRVNGLPSALVSLNMQNCRELKTVTSLSKLVNLKYLNINRCCNLKTLNMEGLASLEEFNAEGCWELQTTEVLSRLYRLNCLNISTDNQSFWEDIREFLRSPTHREPSTAIFSGRASLYTIFGKGDMLRITEKFNLQMHDIVFQGIGQPPVYQRFDKLDAHSAILVCFTTNDAKSLQFSVRFGLSKYAGQKLEYSTITEDRGGRRVHVFMWTEGSRLFKEYSEYSVYSNFLVSSLVKEEEAMERGLGWIILVDKKPDVSKICREFIKVVCG